MLSLTFHMVFHNLRRAIVILSFCQNLLCYQGNGRWDTKPMMGEGVIRDNL